MALNDLVIFTTNYPYGSGETFLEEEIRVLAQHFDHIRICPLYCGASIIMRPLPDGVMVTEPLIGFDIKFDRIKLLMAGIINKAPLWFAVAELFKHKLWSSRAALIRWLSISLIARVVLSSKVLYNILRQSGPSTGFYFYWGDKSSVIVPFLRKAFSNPIIVRFHGSDLYEELSGGFPFRDHIMRDLNYAVAVSEKGKSYIEQKYNLTGKLVKLFRLGVRSNPMAKPGDDGTFRLVSCSNMVPVKRIHLIVRALKYLKFPVFWTHIGSGPLMDVIKRQTGELPAHIKVFFPGQLENRDVFRYFAENPVDLFVNVSESEGIPVSAMEAIASGIPVMATDVGGTAEVVNNNFGYLLPANPSVGEIASELEKFHNLDARKVMEMKLAAVEHWQEHFYAERNYGEFARFLKQLG